MTDAELDRFEKIANDIKAAFDAKAEETQRLVEAKAEETQRHFDAKAEETQRLVEAKAEETQRHFDIVAEHLTSQIQLVAEGHGLLNSKIDRLAETVAGHTAQLVLIDAHVIALRQGQDKLQQGQDELRHEVSQIRSEAAEFRSEVATEFKEVRSMITLSYSELDGRLRTLEHDVADLRGRLDRLEARLPS